jgi:hypothetical protein
MADSMRCLVCEELMELMDTCEACIRHEYLPPPFYRTGRPPASAIPGICIRGHAMIKGVRWRCKPCEAIYAERKRLRRKAMR